MTMVSAVALGTMLGNDVVLPFLLRRRKAQEQADMTRVILVVRRALVAGILLLAFAIQRLIDQDAYLVKIGLMSFVAAAQLAPAFFGGLYWRKASTTGVVAGMTLGFAVWFYALLLPSIANAVGLSPDFIIHGPWNIDWLRPQNLFGLGFADAMTNTAVCSLALNVGAFVLLSLVRPATQADLDNALAFEHIANAALVETGSGDTVRDLADYAAQFVGGDYANTAFIQYVQKRAQQSNQVFNLTSHVDDAAIRFGETLIAGAIGAASARIVMAAWIGRRRRLRGPERATLQEASAALREKHALLRAITENVQQGICAFDAELRMTVWNSRFEQLLDLPAGTFKVGMPLADVIALNRARGEYTAEQFDRLIVNRDRATLTWPYSYERTRPDGTVLEVTFYRIGVDGYVATYVDVTDRHRAAQALRAANELLEDRVRERTLALDQAKMEAERANADKTRFLAAASHDLLQPLTAARLFLSAQQAGLRERNAMTPDPGVLAAYADNALAALESTEGLLTELLYMSSLDARAITPQIQNVDINALLSQLRTEFMPLAAKRGLQLRVASTTLAGLTDPGLLRRVLQNLISNAIRYTPGGRVLIGCRRRGDRLRIEVWDTGIGIPEDMRNEIFVEFRRLAGEPANAEQGAGLGLAIADRIARLIGATLTLRSRVGHGSVFAIEIARAAAGSRANALPEAAQPAVADEQSMLILCIDNDRRIRDGMKALLERWGHRAVCADSLETISACLGNATPDIALIDYHLDGARSGLELLATLRPLWEHEVPVVIVTADRSEAVREATRAAGCGLLHKPVKPAALRRCVNEARRGRINHGETS
jgi:signal transduction histidine kinase/ActR/RegA family two-component response regulator